MLGNYLKVAFRNLVRFKGYSLINITGLAIGMAACLLMLLWISNELSFDKFNANADRLFRVEQDQKTSEGIFHVNIVPYPMGPALKEEIPEIKRMSRYVSPGTILIRYKDAAFFETSARAVDPSFLQMFSFPLLKGDAETVLNEPFSVVINEDIARKYFGAEDPIGKTLTINTTHSCIVTGVMKKVPSNSSIRPEVLVTIEFLKRAGIYADTWGSNQIVTWIELNHQEEAGAVNSKITAIYLKNLAPLIPSPEEFNQYLKRAAEFKLMPLPDLRLRSTFGYGGAQENYQGVIIFSVMAAFILLIACINFMNLSTARSANRAKEVGLRKVVGAARGNIVFQFFSESILMTFIALLFALILVETFLPVFNFLSGKHLDPAAPFNIKFLPLAFAIALITGIISGTYPALFLSRFEPIQTLKGGLNRGSKSPLFRKILVVLQFSLSVILIVATFVIYQQVKYLETIKVGYDKDQLIYLPLRGETTNTYLSLKQELLKDARISGVSGSSQLPTNMGANSGGADWEGKDPNFQPLIGIGNVDYDYVETMKIELVEGRSFSQEYATDSSKAILVNEGVVKLMGVQSAVGKTFSFNGVNNGTIIGVMKNYHYQSIHNVIEPLAVFLVPARVNYAIVRLGTGGSLTSALDQVKAIWQKINPQYPFEYTFFDQDIEENLQSDRHAGSIFNAAAILAMAIACLGLFGLASFMIEQRTKEIGIRKTLGASITGITTMLSKEFVQWVVVANLIGWPIAYYILNKLLQSYAYRVTIDWMIFLYVGLISLLIALLTVSYQSVRAARANPVDSLKYE
ncbi:MAG: ABC transporter permease [bacterium]|nr:ABC transporter permease [bacterium]